MWNTFAVCRRHIRQEHIERHDGTQLGHVAVWVTRLFGASRDVKAWLIISQLTACWIFRGKKNMHHRPAAAENAALAISSLYQTSNPWWCFLHLLEWMNLFFKTEGEHLYWCEKAKVCFTESSLVLHSWATRKCPPTKHTVIDNCLMC